MGVPMLLRSLAPYRRPRLPPPLRLTVLGLSIALLVAALLAGPPAPGESGPEGSQDTLAIDLSHHSGAVDWAVVKASGYRIAYIKATEGLDAIDPRFAENWREAGEAGLLRGAYHFYVTEDDPTEQAELFLSTVGSFAEVDLIPVVDVEVIGRGTQPGLADRLRTFLGLVEKATGVKPMIYTSPNFWDSHLDDSFGDYPLWVAEYGVEVPRLPGGWERWLLWQWIDNRRVNGIEKDVDLNRLHPEIEAFHLQIRHRRGGNGTYSADGGP